MIYLLMEEHGEYDSHQINVLFASKDKDKINDKMVEIKETLKAKKKRISYLYIDEVEEL